ncbi:MAG: glycoside hydrolase family 26 protein [Treponema sp.]|nr:glycoside hydrolase family 26 protein [Treponema sp.]
MNNYKPCNKNASQEARNLLDYLWNLRGNGILLGQHTQTPAQEELCYISEVTGKAPALCGFELLAYSPNINYKESDEECLKEVEENKNTLEKAFKWAERKGIITFTWHWFSPLYGKGKAFYQEKTEWDARLALQEGTPERKAFLSDMDVMAKLLEPFKEKRIPILWRPFHEAEGHWFWWGNKGPQTAKNLYLDMFERFVNVHQLNNLIWVWNSPVPEGYVGDEYCDVISRDMYQPKNFHGDLGEGYEELMRITKAEKIAALGETGPVPGMSTLSKTRVPWTWFMTWSKGVCAEDVTSREELKAAYNSGYGITLDKLPALY